MKKETIVTASRAEAERVAESAIDSFNAEYYEITEVKVKRKWDNTEAIKGETLDEMNIATKLCLLSER